MSDANNGRSCACVGAVNIWESSVPLPKFCDQPKTTLKRSPKKNPTHYNITDLVGVWTAKKGTDNQNSNRFFCCFLIFYFDESFFFWCLLFKKIVYSLFIQSGGETMWSFPCLYMKNLFFSTKYLSSFFFLKIASMEFSRPEYWCGETFPSPRDLPNPGIKLGFPALPGGSSPTELSRKPISVQRRILIFHTFLKAFK